MTLPTSRAPKRRDRTAFTLLCGVLIAGAVTGAATLSQAGTDAWRSALEFTGIAPRSDLEQEQRRQAAALERLDGIVDTLSGTVGDAARQAYAGASQQEDLVARLAELDRELGSLREQIAREGLFQQDTVLRGALTDLASMREAFEAGQAEQKAAVADLSSRVAQSEAASTSALADLTRRVQTMEAVLAAREATSAIPVKRKRRATSTSRRRAAQAPQPLLTAPRTVSVPDQDGWGTH
jgi:chromosome segregation ATPase